LEKAVATTKNELEVKEKQITELKRLTTKVTSDKETAEETIKELNNKIEEFEIEIENLKNKNKTNKVQANMERNEKYEKTKTRIITSTKSL